jgi:hypothetical protein
MSKLHTYSPEDVSVSIAGAVLSGYSEGTFVVVSREEDAYSKVVGSDGDVTRSKNANKSGTIALTLKASSPSNDILSGLATKDELDGSGVAPIIVKDNSGTTICGGKGWVRKKPDAEFAKEVGDREWTFDVGTLTMFIGGNTEE